MTFSANASNPNGTDASIFGSSQVVVGSATGSKHMPGPQPAGAGAAAYPASAAAPSHTAVYINSALPQQKLHTTPKATKVRVPAFLCALLWRSLADRLDSVMQPPT